MAERDPAGIPHLATKLLIPQVRQSLVSRPRLTERLNGGLHDQLTLVCAHAGFEHLHSHTAHPCHHLTGRQSQKVGLAQKDLCKPGNRTKGSKDG